MEKAIPYTGNLKEYSLYQILIFLNKKQKTGIFTIERGDIEKNIYIENGQIIFASSNQEEDRLGMQLVKSGKITPTQRDESLNVSKQANKRQGITLVELGYLSPKELFHELKNQIMGIIYRAFLWEDGVFKFEEIESLPEIVRIKVDMGNLLRECLIRQEKQRQEKNNYFVQRVNELYGNIDELNYYDALEVNLKSSVTDIKKAYLRLAKEYHPDGAQGLQDPALKDRLTAVFTFINKAYNTLIDEVKRAEYNTYLLRKTPRKSPGDETLRAEEQFKRGVEALKEGNFWGATDLLRWATRLNPQKAAYWGYLSLALSSMPRREKEAETAILKAIELSSHNADYYVHLGTIYLKSGMKKRAINQFETALRWDPTNKKAQRELEKLRKTTDNR